MDVGTDSDPMIKQGAEGRVYKIKFLGKAAVMKERFVKTYRHPELDSRLTKERIRAEAKSIVRCKNAGKNLRILIHSFLQLLELFIFQVFVLRPFIRSITEPTELSWNISKTAKPYPSTYTSIRTRVKSRISKH